MSDTTSKQHLNQSLHPDNASLSEATLNTDKHAAIQSALQQHGYTVTPSIIRGAMVSHVITEGRAA